MSMCNAGTEKVSVIQYTGMKLRVVNTGPNKRWGTDPADSKSAVLKCGAVKVCVFWQTIDGHLVKIGFPEKSGWKAYLGGPVKYY